MVGAGRRAEATTLALIARLPGIRPAMFERVAEETRDHPAAMLRAPWQGVPYKLYAVEAGRQGQSLPGFLLWSIPARLLRFIPLTLAAAGIGWWFRPAIERRPTAWAAAVLGLWSAGLAWFFWSV